MGNAFTIIPSNQGAKISLYGPNGGGTDLSNMLALTGSQNVNGPKDFNSGVGTSRMAIYSSTGRALLTIGNVTTNDPNLYFHYGFGAYTAAGDFWKYSIYAFKDTSYGRVYSLKPLVFVGGDDQSARCLHLTASWNSVSGADGYRIVPEDLQYFQLHGVDWGQPLDTAYTSFDIGYGTCMLVGNMGKDGISNQTYGDMSNSQGTGQTYIDVSYSFVQEPNNSMSVRSQTGVQMNFEKDIVTVYTDFCISGNLLGPSDLTLAGRNQTSTAGGSIILSGGNDTADGNQGQDGGVFILGGQNSYGSNGSVIIQGGTNYYGTNGGNVSIFAGDCNYNGGDVLIRAGAGGGIDSGLGAFIYISGGKGVNNNSSVGINTMGPNATLDVNGSGNFTSGLTVSGRLAFNGSTGKAPTNTGTIAAWMPITVTGIQYFIPLYK